MEKLANGYWVTVDRSKTSYFRTVGWLWTIIMYNTFQKTRGNESESFQINLLFIVIYSHPYVFEYGFHATFWKYHVVLPCFDLS
jgi:hypothetical protein